MERTVRRRPSKEAWVARIVFDGSLQSYIRVKEGSGESHRSTEDAWKTLQGAFSRYYNLLQKAEKRKDSVK